MDRTEPAQKGKKGGEASSEYLLVFIIADSICSWLGRLLIKTLLTVNLQLSPLQPYANVKMICNNTE